MEFLTREMILISFLTLAQITFGDFNLKCHFKCEQFFF
jgi:hypothetical protein